MSDDKLPSLIRDLGSRQKRVPDINRYCEDQFRKNRIQGFSKSKGYSSDALIFLAQSICKASLNLVDKIVEENKKIQSMMEGLKMANMALLECRKGVLSRSKNVAGRGEMFDLGEKRFTLQGVSVPVDSRSYPDFPFTRTSRVLERIEQDRIIVNDSDREKMRWNYSDMPSKQSFKSTAKGLAMGSVMDISAARNRPLSFAEPTPRHQTSSNFAKNTPSSRGRRAPPPRREDVPPAGRGPSPPRRRQAPPPRKPEPSNVELSSEDEDDEPPAPTRRAAPPRKPSSGSRAPPPRKPEPASERRAPPPRKSESSSERRAPPPRRSAPPARRQAPPPRSTSSSSSSSSSSGGGAFAKYQKMLNMHIPMPAVVSKMRGDGFSDADIRAFKSGGSGGGSSAPRPSGAKKKMGGGLLASIQKGKKLKKTKTVVKDGSKKSGASKPKLTGKPRNPMEEMLMMREKMKKKKKKKRKGAPPMKKLW